MFRFKHVTQLVHFNHFGGGWWGVTTNLLATLSFCGNRVLELAEEDGLDALPSPGSYSGRGGEGGLWWEALPHPHFQGRESARTAG